MGAPDRTAAIETLDDGHRRVLSLIRGLTDPQLTRRRTIGGGDWSVKDLLAHMTTWEEAALDSLTAWRSGSADPVREALRSEGVDAFNARWIKAKATTSLARVRTEFRSVHWRLTGGPGGAFRHAWAHLGDLEDYVRSLG
jgi:Mycothiol maleylpyruvate isomerase N-terminal domain